MTALDHHSPAAHDDLAGDRQDRDHHTHHLHHQHQHQQGNHSQDHLHQCPKMMNDELK